MQQKIFLPSVFPQIPQNFLFSHQPTFDPLVVTEIDQLACCPSLKSWAEESGNTKVTNPIGRENACCLSSRRWWNTNSKSEEIYLAWSLGTVKYKIWHLNYPTSHLKPFFGKVRGISSELTYFANHPFGAGNFFSLQYLDKNSKHTRIIIRWNSVHLIQQIAKTGLTYFF